MLQEGQIVLFRFPQADQQEGKLRPALVLRKLPGRYDDWLICMISSQTLQFVEGIDDLLMEQDADFAQTGLKCASVIRVTRLAVVEKTVLIGSIGTLSPQRLDKIRADLGRWISGAAPVKGRSIES
jgi:mRNA interferase MazF